MVTANFILKDWLLLHICTPICLIVYAIDIHNHDNRNTYLYLLGHCDMASRETHRTPAGWFSGKCAQCLDLTGVCASTCQWPPLPESGLPAAYMLTIIGGLLFLTDHTALVSRPDKPASNQVTSLIEPSDWAEKRRGKSTICTQVTSLVELAPTNVCLNLTWCNGACVALVVIAGTIASAPYHPLQVAATSLEIRGGGY